MNRMGDACLEFFEATNLTQTKWFNIRNLLTTILDLNWDKLPKSVREDGRAPNGLVKYREDQLKVAASRVLEPIGNSTEWRVKRDPDDADDDADGRSKGKVIGKNFVPIYRRIAVAVDFIPPRSNGA